MSRRWLYRAWRRLPLPLQHVLLWWGNAHFVVGALGLIADERGRVLLLRHSYRRVGQWGLPGGWVKGHEAPPEAVAREVREETGLEVEVGPALAVLRGADMRRLDIVYRCRVKGGRLALDDEIDEAAYLAPGDLPADMFPEQAALIAAALLNRPTDGPRS